MRNETNKTVLDSWIDFAKRKRVCQLELDLCLPYYNTSYKFPHGIGFPNLIVLQLTSVDVTDETLAYLISSDNCPLLQHVSIKRAPSLEHVKVVGNLKLKSLEFDMCCNVKDVEIYSAVNLVSFGFCGRRNPKITFEDVPLLTKTLFGFDCFKNAVMQLSSFLSQLEILVLDLISSDNLVGARNFPKFDRLKHLEVHACNHYYENLNLSVMAMIYRCPCLQKLSLSLKTNYTNNKGRSVAFKKFHYICRHECLRAVEYSGWNGKKNELELIIDIHKNTVALDKVTIDPRTTFDSKEYELKEICRNRKFHILYKKREEAAKKAAEKLRTILPRRVTLEIL